MLSVIKANRGTRYFFSRLTKVFLDCVTGEQTKENDEFYYANWVGLKKYVNLNFSEDLDCLTYKNTDL